jgi:hypothetical protein
MENKMNRIYLCINDNGVCSAEENSSDTRPTSCIIDYMIDSREKAFSYVNGYDTAVRIGIFLQLRKKKGSKKMKYNYEKYVSTVGIANPSLLTFKQFKRQRKGLNNGYKSEYISTPQDYYSK